MRILLTLLILCSPLFAFANDADIYVVKKGEVSDWHDVLHTSPNYRARYASLGIDDLVARLNGSPKLRPGTRIRLAPLDEMVNQSNAFERWREASKVLLDTRTFALGRAEAACKNGFLEDDLSLLKQEAESLHARLSKLVPSLPRNARVQARQLQRFLQNPRSNRERAPTKMASTCKNYLGILKRSGWALRELHKHATSASRGGSID